MRLYYAEEDAKSKPPKQKEKVKPVSETKISDIKIPKLPKQIEQKVEQKVEQKPEQQKEQKNYIEKSRLVRNFKAKLQQFKPPKYNWSKTKEIEVHEVEPFRASLNPKILSAKKAEKQRPETSSVIQKPKMQKLDVKPQDRMSLGRKRHAEEGQISPTEVKKSRIVCRNYSKSGSCKFGDKCRFIHEKPVQRETPSTTIQQSTQPENILNILRNKLDGDNEKVMQLLLNIQKQQQMKNSNHENHSKQNDKQLNHKKEHKPEKQNDRQIKSQNHKKEQKTSEYDVEKRRKDEVVLWSGSLRLHRESSSQPIQIAMFGLPTHRQIVTSLSK